MLNTYYIVLAVFNSLMAQQWGPESFREPSTVKLIRNFSVNNRLYARFHLAIRCH